MISYAQKPDIVICGAGIAGIAVAYFLSKAPEIGKVLLVDERAPLTLTSDKSSEGYRNWWPGPDDAMVRLMDRSIDLMEALADESDNRFHMNRRGYIYLTSDPASVPKMHCDAAEISRLGAGPLRVDQTYTTAPVHGYEDQPRGADLLLDPDRIRSSYPFLSQDVAALLHARRCGWLSAQQLGMLMLEKARDAGVGMLNGRIVKISTRNNQVESVFVHTKDGEVQISTPVFVNAAGPFVKSVASLLDVDLPLYNEPHAKIAIEDKLGIIPRNAPLMIWNDPIILPWLAEERQELAAFNDTAWMLDPFPPGFHFRPEGGSGSKTVLILWPYHTHKVEQPEWPLNIDPEFVEIVLRGMVRMVPGLGAYLNRMNAPTIDGGYYTKTRENRPLICPLPAEGAYVIGGLSGYGIMAAMAGAELLTGHICGNELPGYAPAFNLTRYTDPEYQALFQNWDVNAGQL